MPPGFAPWTTPVRLAPHADKNWTQRIVVNAPRAQEPQKETAANQAFENRNDMACFLYSERLGSCSESSADILLPAQVMSNSILLNSTLQNTNRSRGGPACALDACTSHPQPISAILGVTGEFVMGEQAQAAGQPWSRQHPERVQYRSARRNSLRRGRSPTSALSRMAGPMSSPRSITILPTAPIASTSTAACQAACCNIWLQGFRALCHRHATRRPGVFARCQVSLRQLSLCDVLWSWPHF